MIISSSFYSSYSLSRASANISISSSSASLKVYLTRFAAARLLRDSALGAVDFFGFCERELSYFVVVLKKRKK